MKFFLRPPYEEFSSFRRSHPSLKNIICKKNLSLFCPVFAVLDPDPLTPGDHKEMSSTLADQ